MASEKSGQIEQHKSGHCRICDPKFVWMDEKEYKSAASLHIVENHRDQPIDKPLVVPDGC